MEDQVSVQEERDRDGDGGRDSARQVAVQGQPRYFLDGDAKPVDQAEDQGKSHEAAPSWVAKNKMTVEFEAGHHAEDAANQGRQGKMAAQPQTKGEDQIGEERVYGPHDPEAKQVEELQPGFAHLAPLINSR